MKLPKGNVRLKAVEPKKLVEKAVKSAHRLAVAVLGTERLRILASGVRSVPSVGPLVQDWLDETVGTPPRKVAQPAAAPAVASTQAPAAAASPAPTKAASDAPASKPASKSPHKPGPKKGEPQAKPGAAKLPTDSRPAPAPVAVPVAVEPESLESLDGLPDFGKPVIPAPGASAWNPEEHIVPPEEGKTRFQELPLAVEIRHALSDLEFNYCTPIQAQSLPHTLTGRDVAGKAQTGTGKTAAFLLTIYQRLLDQPTDPNRPKGLPRALCLAPTRELALQIEKDARLLGKYVPHRIVTVFGGMDYQKQLDFLQAGPVDILVATPGRLLDFRRKRAIRLDQIEVLVIDEADRMLDMGFIPDVTNIVASCPPKDKRQTLFFGATLTPEVNRLAARWTKDAATLEVAPEQVASANIEQLVFLVTMRERFPLLLNTILRQNLERVIVFTNRRDEARRLKERLEEWGLPCALLSGEVEQSRRIRALERFRDGSVRIMVATDVAARGLHVEGISHVVNYSLPIDPEDYVHRIGRTGRAGASGISVSFATEADSFHIPDIEEFLGRSLHCQHPDDSMLVLPPRPKGGPVASNPDDTLAAPQHDGDRGPRPGGRPGGGRPGGRPSGRPPRRS